MVLTAYSALSPVTGLSCHRRYAGIASRQLDASVGASGPHDFAVRKHAPSSEAPLASTTSRPASVTIAIRPSVGRDGGINKAVSSKRRSEKFFDGGLDRQITTWPVGQISRPAAQPQHKSHHPPRRSSKSSPSTLRPASALPNMSRIARKPSVQLVFAVASPVPKASPDGTVEVHC